MRELRVDPQPLGVRTDRERQGRRGTGRTLSGRVSAFAPILGEAPQVLILGSLPGVASLAAGQYYAHPRNQFWDLMGTLVGASRDLSYEARCTRLIAAGVAVWDVLHAAQRPGSLDSRIVAATAQPNDFGAFLAAQPQLQLIAFNGATAAKLFARLAAPRLTSAPRQVTLPSTSPAHAALTQAQKLGHWRIIAGGLE
jgi:hypoxanthine-DNA glycosylase